MRKAVCSIKEIEYGDNVTAYIYVPTDLIKAFSDDVKELSGARAKVLVRDGAVYRKI